MKQLLGISAAFVLALSLSACGGAEPTPAASTPTPAAALPSSEVEDLPMDSDVDATQAMPAGEFQLFALSGADIKFTLPTPVTDKRLNDIEAYRKDTGAKPVTYLIADVDNRKGTEFVNMYNVSAYDADGMKYEFSTISEHISDWGPTFTGDYEYVMPDGKKLSEPKGQELSDRSVELHNKYLDGIDSAERGTIIMLSEDGELPREFTRVAVQPSGGMEEAQEAFPAE